MSNINKQQASTLIEVLVAISVIALVLTAVGAMISMSIKLADSNEQNQLALQKAQEAMEFFRKERSVNSWQSFSTPLTDDGVYCLNVLPSSVASLSAQLGNCGSDDLLEAVTYEFTREASINFNGENSLTATIDLDWQDGNKEKNVSISQNFENY